MVRTCSGAFSQLRAKQTQVAPGPFALFLLSTVSIAFLFKKKISNLVPLMSKGNSVRNQILACVLEEILRLT